MGRLRSANLRNLQAKREGRGYAHTFRQPNPPPPVLVAQEFVGLKPSGTTIIQLSRSANGERTILAQRVIEQFLGHTPEQGRPDEYLALETATAFFLATIAVRAGMRQRGRNNGDEKVLRDMQNILVNCITRENARGVAVMMRSITTDHLGAIADDRRATARPVMQRILAHGFVAVVPEIRIMERDVLVVATVYRDDSYGGWATVTNMRIPSRTLVPPRPLVLVSRPLPRPFDWTPGQERNVSYMDGGAPVFIDPSFIR